MGLILYHLPFVHWYKSSVSVWIAYERGWVHTYRRWHTHTAHGVRTPPTVRVHSRTLPTVSLHLWTLTHENRRLGTVWRDGDAWRRCGCAHRTSRRNAHTTRLPGTVCVHKSATPHAPARIYATSEKPRAHDFFHWVCTCWSVRLSACFTLALACPIFYLNLNLYRPILDIFILLLLYFSLCIKCTI